MTLSNRFWQQLSLLIGLMAIGVFFALTFFFSSIEIKDFDLWLHIGTGRYICENGYIPTNDVLTCTIAGKPWVNHEWLFQVLVYQVHQFWGFDGLIQMQVVVVFATFMLVLFLGYSRRSQLPLVFTMMLVLLVYMSRFTIRPDIFSLLFFITFILMLTKYIHHKWSLYVLILLQVLWVNMHGFFFFGPLLAMIGVLAEWMRRKLPLPAQWNQAGSLSDQGYTHIKLAVLLLIGASLFNPLTFKGAWYPLGVLFGLGGDSKVFFQHIVELQKPLTSATIWTSSYLYYKILIILSAYSFFLNRRRIDLSVLFLWLLFLVFSLMAIRNLVFFSFAACLVFMVNIATVNVDQLVPFRFSNEKFKSITGLMAKGLLIMWMLNFGLDNSANGYFDFDTYERKSEFWGVSKRSYPYKAVDFLVKNKVKGNAFNDFNSGAYLVGRTHPNIKVFIDGRTEVYGAVFFERYQKIWREGDNKIFEDFAKDYNITIAFLNSSNQEIPSKVLKMFYGFKYWSVIYFDDDALIFIKQTAANKSLIDQYAIDLKKWEPNQMDLLKLGSKRIEPFIFTNRAYTLESLGLLGPAMKEARMALQIAPDWVPSYKLIGKIYGRRKQHAKAFEYLRIVSMYNPHDIKSRGNLAFAYENLKDYKGMAEQYKRIVEDEPNDPKGYFGLAKTFALQGKDRKAIETLKIAHQLALKEKPPKDKVDVKKIHDIISKHQLSPELKQLLNEAIK